MGRFISLFLLAALAGCASNEKAPLLSRRAELQFNTDQTVRIIGTARFSKVTGPSVIGDDFELRIYPTNVWGAEADGKRVEVTGKVHNSAQATPPDPSVLPVSIGSAMQNGFPRKHRRRQSEISSAIARNLATFMRLPRHANRRKVRAEAGQADRSVGGD